MTTRLIVVLLLSFQKTIPIDGEDAIQLQSVTKLEEWVVAQLELILFQSTNTNTLIVGRLAEVILVSSSFTFKTLSYRSLENCYDCLLVACLRKVQEWAYVSILAEFRHNVWPHKLFDLEQFIERFDQSLVDLSTSAPDYLLTHNSIQVTAANC